MPPVVTVIDGTGQPHDIAEADLAFTLRSNPDWRVQSEAEGVARATQAAEAEKYSGAGNALDAAAARAWGAATMGGTDAAMGLLGGDQAKHKLRKLQEHQQLASGVGDVIGGITAAATGFGPIGEASALGARVAKTAEGAGALTQIARAGAGAAIEGGAQGLGSGISELALSDDPLTTERVFSTLSSRTIYGAATGAAAGSLAKSAEIGMLKGKQVLDDLAAKQAAHASVGDDLARLNARELSAAEKVEREAIEAARVPQRQQLADEIASFRRELKQSKQAILTKDVKLAAEGEKLSSGELGKLALKANRQLDNLLDNPIAVAKNPAKALDALQRQEHALQKLMERTDDLKLAYAADTTPARMQALETVAPSLERNRALQAKIADLAGEASSPRLQQIADAKLALQSGGGKSLAEQMAGSTAFGMASDVARSIPVIGPLMAPLVGAKAANLVSEKVFGRLGVAVGEKTARAAKAAAAVLEKSSRGMKYVAPVATRVLSQVSFAPDRGEPAPKGATLHAAFKERTKEIREAVVSTPAGPVVKPHVRQRIADNLKAVGAVSPLLADKMETLAAKKLVFLASKMPKRPEIEGIPLGPDNWQPSEMEMRSWARYVAAAEDPDAVLERVAHGQVSPEDAETMRELYPEQLNAFTMQVLTSLPELRTSMPYERRLALSILTGVPVDPSLDPRILAALQSIYTAQPEPPTPKPAFGSVKNFEAGTPSQRREQGA